MDEFGFGDAGVVSLVEAGDDEVEVAVELDDVKSPGSIARSFPRRSPRNLALRRK